jgi:hypothetical protein
MGKNKLSSVSKTKDPDSLGAFWDSHDFSEFDDENKPDVDFKITCAVPIELDLFTSVEKQARLRGVSIETLINLWLLEKLEKIQGQ